MKILLKRILKFFGFELRKINNTKNIKTFYSNLNQLKIIDLEKLSVYNSFIDGMITDYQGKILFILCYTQVIKGDVLEIGSFKGKSTSYLYRAIEQTNDSLIVIDHFQGVIGKENIYGDFKDIFIENMNKIGNIKKIKIHNGKSTEMLNSIKDNSLRFIYIDGDHTFEGIKNDLTICLNKLKKNGIIVLDDYFNGFPELVESVNLIIKDLNKFSFFTFAHNLVLIKK